MSKPKVKDFISDITSISELAIEMKKIGRIYITSDQQEARLLADWMFRFGTRLEKIEKKRKRDARVKSVEDFVQELEAASEATKGSQMRFK